MSAELIETQDISSGSIHRRYRMPGGQLASIEGCNLDDAGAYRVLLPDRSNAETGYYCRNCFPAEDDPTMGQVDQA